MFHHVRLIAACSTFFAILLLCASETASDPANQYVHAHVTNCSKIFQTLDIDFNETLPMIIADLIEQPWHWLYKHPGVVKSFDDWHHTFALSTSFYDLPHSYILHEMIGNAEAVVEPLRYYRTHFRYIDRAAIEALAHLAYLKVREDTNNTLANSTFTVHPSIQWKELQFVGLVPSPFYLVYLSMTCWLLTIHAFLRLRFMWILSATSL
ncbi:glycoprotein 2 [Kappaarterivirus wobum]|nr:glycoprotein 2 [Kappaarterivirus wobum]